MSFHVHGDRNVACQRLAARLAARLRQTLAARGAASLVVSGGSSPIGLFAHLSRAPLDWSRVTIVPSDERWVSLDDSASNEGAIRRHLLINHARDAQVLSLYDPDRTPPAACDAVRSALSELARPFSAVLLGLGLDGHTASLFPEARNIDALLAGNAECVVPDLANAQVQRISLSLRCLLSAEHIDLLFFGADKRAVYERACLPGEISVCPVRGVLQQQRVPCTAHWAA